MEIQQTQPDDEVLQDLALGKGMDYAQWPALYTRLLARLEQIVYNEFPIPKAPVAKAPKQESPSLDSSMESEIPTEPNTQPTDEEKDKPTPKPSAELDIFPQQVQLVYKSILSSLSNLFTEYPPHTIQRLAELILKPSEHYRTLPAYLHALDRVVHVTSGAQTFPLPPAVPSPSSAKVLSNGITDVDPLTVSWSNAHDKTATSTLGSDDSLGGALLTPISWLTRPSSRAGSHSPMEGEVRTESTTMTDGPNGPGGIETVTVSVNGVQSTIAPPAEPEDDVEATLRAEGGITQGELLRQEQRAGVVPAGQINRGDSDGMGEEDEPPHARGPEEIGMEDMGPQSSSGTDRKIIGPNMQGIDIEAAVGRKVDDESDVKEEDTKMEDGEEQESEKGVKEEAKEVSEAEEPTTPKREADSELVSEEKRTKVEDESEDMDVKMEIVDADGKTADEPKIGEKGETKGADAVDTTSL